MAKNEQTTKRAGANASKVLKNPKSSAPAKGAAGSALTQQAKSTTFSGPTITVLTGSPFASRPRTSI
jgi:hypothetical protein